MLNASGKPYETLDVVEDRRDGKLMRYVAIVAVGAQIRQRSFWICNRDCETIKRHATKWANNQRAELLSIHNDSAERAAQISEAARIAEAEEFARKQKLSMERVERGTRCVRQAVSIYGKGREGYWTGYVNVYGQFTDGDQ